MIDGKSNKENSKWTISRAGIIVLSLLLVIVCSIGGTFAFHKYSGGSVENKFAIADAPAPTIDETFENNVKENVCVNVGATYSCFVRAQVVFTLIDKDGEVHPATSEDYTIEYNTTDWQSVGDYWYYKGPTQGTTKPLITTCTQKSRTDGKNLCVDILAQTVQSSPIAAVEEVWKMTYDSESKSWSSK